MHFRFRPSSPLDFFRVQNRVNIAARSLFSIWVVTTFEQARYKVALRTGCRTRSHKETSGSPPLCSRQLRFSSLRWLSTSVPWWYFSATRSLGERVIELRQAFCRVYLHVRKDRLLLRELSLSSPSLYFTLTLLRVNKTSEYRKQIHWNRTLWS